MASRGVGLDLSVPLDAVLASELLARLRAKTASVPRADDLDDCWVWTGYCRNGTHGAMSVNDRPVYIHQLSFAIHHGPLPAGHVVRHRCDNPPRWRPNHILSGGQADNVHDMWQRGRASKPPRHVGEANPKATLTDAKVAELRHLWATRGHSQRDIARRFGVAQATVWRLVHGLTRQEGAA